MQLILGILGFIFIFGLAVLVHELGHFLTARRAGVLCHEFAIGMGPILWKKRKGETLYTFRAIPIGGFVSMGMSEGERDVFKEGSQIGLTLDNSGNVIKIHYQPEAGQIAGTLISNTLNVSTDLEITLRVADEVKVYPVDRGAMYVDAKADRMLQIVPTDRRLEEKPKRQRFLIMAAGALMNFILAYVLVLIVAMISGEVVGTQIAFGTITPNGPADVAGLQQGDIVLEIAGEVIDDSQQISQALQVAGGQEVVIVFERDGNRQQAELAPILRDGVYVMDVVLHSSPIMSEERSLSGVIRSANAMWTDGALFIVNTLHMLVTREVGVDQLAGVVGIVQMTSEVAMLGMLPLLMFASVMNINLGIFNLLPFPGLDGGHLVFVAIEAIIGRPVDAKIQNMVSLAGIALLMLLMVFALYNDIRRIFLG